MKKFVYLCFGLTVGALCHAETQCLKIVQNNQVILEEGDCSVEVTPASTFKIALSLMGYDAGILEKSDLPLWDYDKSKYPEANLLFIWRQAHSPRMWIKHSCIWYSQELTTKMGFDKFQGYINLFDYGNKDGSGNPDKKDGLTQAWLSSSLRISPNQQIKFLKKLVSKTLPVSKESLTYTYENMKYMFVNGQQMYGKTGMGYHVNADGQQDRSRQLGWFVGWLETDGSPLIFAHLIEKKPVEGEIASYIARDEMIETLKSTQQGDLFQVY